MFDAIAGIASIIGVFLTIWSVAAATTAAKAAREAKAEVRKGNAAEEFRRLQFLGAEFLGFLEAGQVDSALVRSRDLTSAMRNASRRWRALISDQDVKTYEESVLQIGVIAQSLAARGAPGNAKEKERLLGICHAVLGVISTVAGAVTARMESQGELNANNL